ncbi:MAG TPA: fused MFS/spermidine synthase [Oculatellaceae cyanobacterium]|jgi:hypothetical protein
MVAKMILPLLGGSPSVWNTCLFFFQTTLLLGYGYSHLTTRWWGTRRQAIIHSFLLLLPIAFLPITVSKNIIPPQNSNPIIWLLALLLLAVGLPFFVVSTSAPLVQKWFANTSHPDSNDPYFLYAASNLGSILGVLSYPILIEPNFTLTQQSWLWAIGYGLLILLIFGCAICLWKFPNAKETTSENSKNIDNQPNILYQQTTTSNLPLPVNGNPAGGWGSTPTPPSIQQQAQWVVLSFLPSSLLLGVTTYITTDIAAIPLLWAVPLAIYLLTFILAFSPAIKLPYQTLIGLLPLWITAQIIVFLLQVMKPMWLWLPFHLIGFLIIGCVFHGELAQSRPNTKYLTTYYLWISVGGVLGGLFNAIAAPLLFQSVLEYPIVMVFSLLLLRTTFYQAEINNSNSELLLKPPADSYLKLRQTLPISIGLLLGTLIVGFYPKLFITNLPGILITGGIFVGIFYAFKLHPVRLLVGLSLILLIGQFYIGYIGGILDTERSFFGVYRVLHDRQRNFNSLLHGTVLHGKQSLDLNRRDEPLTYFHPTSPVGQLFKSFKDDNTANNKNISKIAVLGLGIGTLAAYSEPGQQWTFYEIDPKVEKIARDPNYFTFLQDSKAPFSVVLGDARLQVADAPNNQYDLIFMDAFSSDAVPVHLITKEAIQLYLSKLAPQGLIVINISNRYLNLEPVLGALAENLGLSTLRQLQLNISPEEKEMGKSSSHWVLLARHQNDFGKLVKDSRWQPILRSLNAPLWTDDFSNIFSVLRGFNK